MLVVQLIIRLVVNYQLQADNPADNQAVSFVVYLRRYTTRIQGCEPCNNAGEQLCQLTVELCSSSKLSAFARRTTLL